MKLVRVLVLVWLALVLCGCPGSTLQVQAQAANVVAAAANASLPVLVEAYRLEGMEAIDAVKAQGGTAEQARRAVDEVKARWAPIWLAWGKLKEAENQWATALEAGNESAGAVVALRAAYCELEACWPASVPAMPLSFAKCE